MEYVLEIKYFTYSLIILYLTQFKMENIQNIWEKEELYCEPSRYLFLLFVLELVLAEEEVYNSGADCPVEPWPVPILHYISSFLTYLSLLRRGWRE